MHKRKSIWLLLLLWIGYGIVEPLYAQNDSEKFAVNKLRNKKEIIQPVTNTLIASIDSVKLRMSKATQDSVRAKLLITIAVAYSNIDPDSSIRYAGLALDLYRKMSDKKGEINTIWNFGWLYFQIGDYNKSQEYLLLAQNIAVKENLPELMPANLLLMGANIMNISGNYKKSIELTKQALAIGVKFKMTDPIIIAPSNLCNYYCELNNLDSALYYGKMVWRNADSTHENLRIQVFNTRAKLFASKKEWGNTITVYKNLLNVRKDIIGNNYAGILQSIAKIYQKWGKRDSAIYYADQAFQIVNNSKFFEPAFNNAFLLYELYLPKDKLKALSYLTIANEKREAQLKNNRQFSLRNLEEFDIKERDYEIQKAKTTYQNNVQRIIFISAISIILVIAFSVYVSNRRHRFLNKQLRSQKSQLENTIHQLKETQGQLIQSEKMASLGELTAGIAHEIQNPLNFVNNFSEVNKELLVELKDEIKNGNLDEVNAIADDVISNEEKINHHGKRADAIVKGMLQHSRSSSGVKEPTNINALADEYLRLAYHGLRAKDKDFNATLITDFDDSIGMMNLIPQDIGRVILNLITNAFYASSAKASATADKFDPTVWVSTRKNGDKVLISVKDNGTGIPEKALDKIFQPFFTTKPTGQGTGLGLSLSYDIVKAHGGELTVETKEGEGTEFTIILQ